MPSATASLPSGPTGMSRIAPPARPHRHLYRIEISFAAAVLAQPGAMHRDGAALDVLDQSDHSWADRAGAVLAAGQVSDVVDQDVVDDAAADQVAIDQAIGVQIGAAPERHRPLRRYRNGVLGRFSFSDGSSPPLRRAPLLAIVTNKTELR
jgi:hypothetical protein